MIAHVIFVTLGLKLVPDACCLYFNEWLILIFYVDDIIVIYSRDNQDRMDEFEMRLTKEYELRKFGEAKHFLGIGILRVSRYWLPFNRGAKH